MSEISCKTCVAAEGDEERSPCCFCEGLNKWAPRPTENINPLKQENETLRKKVERLEEAITHAVKKLKSHHAARPGISVIADRLVASLNQKTQTGESIDTETKKG